MRILYDHSIFVVQRYGGISRYFAELIPNIAMIPGTEVSLWMGLYINNYPLPAARRQFVRFGGARRPALRGTHRPALALSDWLFSRFARNSDAQIYHATFYRTLLPRFRGKRVMTVHDLIDERFHPSGRPTPSPLRQSLLDAADGVVCVSESTRRDLRELYRVSDSKIRVIHHGNSLRIPVGGPRLCSEDYILHVGARSGYKNFNLLLRAFAASRLSLDYRLICFGGGKITTAELQAIHTLGLTGRVDHFTGPDEALANYYANAAAFVYPSKYEGFGMPLLEAMHYGCPILAPRTSSIPEVAGEAAMYFDPTDIDDLCLNLKHLLSSAATRDALSRAGRLRERDFTWQRCARQTLDLYESILERPAGASRSPDSDQPKQDGALCSRQ